MTYATLTEEWHGVPVGTRLVIHAHASAGFYHSACVRVSRVDGQPLPTPYGSDSTTVISSELVRKEAA